MPCSMDLLFYRGIRGCQTGLRQMEAGCRPTFLVYYPKQNKSAEHQRHIDPHVASVAKKTSLDAISDAPEGIIRKNPKLFSRSSIKGDEEEGKVNIQYSISNDEGREKSSGASLELVSPPGH